MTADTTCRRLNCVVKNDRVYWQRRAEEIAPLAGPRWHPRSVLPDATKQIDLTSYIRNRYDYLLMLHFHPQLMREERNETELTKIWL